MLLHRLSSMSLSFTIIIRLCLKLSPLDTGANNSSNYSNLWCALTLQGVMSCLYVYIGDVFTLINYTSFVQWFAIGLSVAALLYFRYTMPEAHRPLKVIDTETTTSRYPYNYSAWMVPNNKDYHTNINDLKFTPNGLNTLFDSCD